MSHNHMEYQGKNIDEAVAKACDDLQANRAELEIEIVSAGSTGIFGLGRKKAVIRARRKAASPLASESPLSQAPTPASPKPNAHPRPKGKRPGKGTPLTTARRHPGPEPGPSKAAHPPSEPGPPPTPENIEAIRELTQTLLAKMGFELEVEASLVGGKLRVHIHPGAQVEELVGREGNVLDALQYLMRKIVAQRFPGRLDLSLDAGNYREHRQQELRELALDLARQARATGTSQTMGALNPADRRIVHLALKDDPEIR
ncbi:MAG: Jag N-terminal domain-containing protein, partial [Desulfobacteraceae bacterium]|nr:Jag N-terminal domain-containing protein [Desulfobacteraceae bacterium]